MEVIWILLAVVCLFCGMLIGSRLYYQMRVKKEIKSQLNDRVVQLEEIKWKLEITKLGSEARMEAMRMYHIKLAQIAELKWVLGYIDNPEDQNKLKV